LAKEHAANYPSVIVKMKGQVLFKREIITGNINYKSNFFSMENRIIASEIAKGENVSVSRNYDRVRGCDNLIQRHMHDGK
jgi:hypothetical protein